LKDLAEMFLDIVVVEVVSDLGQVELLILELADVSLSPQRPDLKHLLEGWELIENVVEILLLYAVNHRILSFMG